MTLIVLFYLGAERLLDNRYLRVESRVPTRLGLFIDLFTTGSTAIWFVILADTFPDPMKYNSPVTMETALARNINFYTANLLILYVVDSIFLIIQIIRTSVHRSRDYEIIIENHFFWFWLNVAGVVLLFPVIINFPGHPITDALAFLISDGIAPIFKNYVYLSIYIFVLHLARFIADYWIAFHSYYPQDERKT